MTAEKGSYSSNQIQKLINAGIQNEVVAWSHQFANDDNRNINIPPHDTTATATPIDQRIDT